MPSFSKRTFTLIAVIFTAICLLSCASAASSNRNAATNKSQWNKRPRQFRMHVFSRPDNKGEMQSIRGHSPCWNLGSKRVGSYELNDPLVKITFYRSLDCKGAPSATHQRTSKRNHVLLKARSVLITKVRPILRLGEHDSK